MEAVKCSGVEGKIFRAEKRLCMMRQWWVDMSPAHPTKPTEPTAPGASPGETPAPPVVRLQCGCSGCSKHQEQAQGKLCPVAMVMCQCECSGCNKHTPLVGGVGRGGSCGWGRGWSGDLYLPFNFAVNLKLLKKGIY